jgi:TetR/AcrR family transcriptional regulator, cholesterol catabolism regulator
MTLGERRERQRKLSSGDRASDARWQQILQGAARVFRDKGYAESTLRDVAEAVGIDRASLYYYVGSKEELLVELVRGPLTDIENRINAIVESGASPEEMLRAAIVSHLDSYEQGWPESFVFLGQDLDRLGDAADDFAKLAKRYHASLLHIVGEGQRAGVFRSDIEARLVMYGIIGMCNWVHRWYRPGGRHTLRQVGENFASMIIDGLKRG